MLKSLEARRTLFLRYKKLCLLCWGQQALKESTKGLYKMDFGSSLGKPRQVYRVAGTGYSQLDSLSLMEKLLSRLAPAPQQSGTTLANAGRPF